MNNELIHVLAEKFGLRPPQKIDRPNNAMLASVYILDEEFVLRGRPYTVDAEENLLGMVRLLNHVREFLTLQLPSYLLSDDGFCGLSDGDHIWTAYPVIKGKTLCNWYELKSSNAETDQYVLNTLQEFHSQTRGKLRGDSEAPPVFIGKCLNTLDMITPSLSAPERKRLTKAIDVVGESWVNMKRSDDCFIHGDFHHGNIICNDAGVPVGLIDLDYCRVGHPFEDIAFTVMMMLRMYDGPKFSFDLQRMNDLIQWTGIQSSQRKVFNAYVLLYALFDIGEFTNAEFPNVDYYLTYQYSMLSELCRVL